MKMGKKLFTFWKRISLPALLAVFCLCSVMITENTANAQTYVATIDVYQPKLAMVQFTHNDPNVTKKTLFLPVNDKTQVFSGKEKVKLAEVWQKTKKVRIEVEGAFIKRIDILEWQ
jgi:hypothetical protein